MAVFRVERTRDYTVMSNYHLRDKQLSLKAKGLLSQMLSLPDDWDYTLTGLACINKESKDAIRSAINELEDGGYIKRYQKVDKSGKFGGNEYVIFEKPVDNNMIEPSLEKPSSENPTSDYPLTGNPTQRNTEESKKDELSIDSFLSGEKNEMTEMEQYRVLIYDNVGYNYLIHDNPFEKDIIDEIVELIIETICTKKKSVRVAGNDFAHEVVKSRFLKLDGNHIRFILACMKANTSKVRNMKQYLLTVLFNAPTTINNYYSSLVNHDMYGTQCANGIAPR